MQWPKAIAAFDIWSSRMINVATHAAYASEAGVVHHRYLVYLQHFQAYKFLGLWRRFREVKLCVVLAFELEQVVDGRRTDICADNFDVPVH